MQVPIGEVIQAAHVAGLSKVRAINILKESEEYCGCLDTNGKYVNGDIDEIANYLREECNRTDPEGLIGEQDTIDINAHLRKEVARLESELSPGDEVYEYKTIIIQDSAVLGKTDAEQIELTLNKYALQGWRLKAAITNELGHNRAVVVNATINNTVLILERLVVYE